MPVEFESGNRLTIPVYVRKLLKIKEDDFLFFHIEDGKIILSKIDKNGYPIKVRKLFRITFPKTFRELYKIKSKDKFYLEAIDGEIVLQRIKEQEDKLNCFTY